MIQKTNIESVSKLIKLNSEDTLLRVANYLKKFDNITFGRQGRNIIIYIAVLKRKKKIGLNICNVEFKKDRKRYNEYLINVIQNANYQLVDEQKIPFIFDSYTFPKDSMIQIVTKISNKEFVFRKRKKPLDFQIKRQWYKDNRSEWLRGYEKKLRENNSKPIQKKELSSEWYRYQNILRKGYMSSKQKLEKAFFWGQPNSELRKVLIDFNRKNILKERIKERNERNERNLSERFLSTRRNILIIYPSGRELLGRIQRFKLMTIIEPILKGTAIWVINTKDTFVDIINLKNIKYRRIYHVKDRKDMLSYCKDKWKEMNNCS